jgi:hypothetical protein
LSTTTSFKRQIRNDAALAAHDLGVEQHARFGDELAVEQVVHAGQHVGARDIGHEAEAPLVDAHQRHPIACQLPCGIEHGAVATDDDRQVGVRTEPGETAARPTSQAKCGDHVGRRLLLDQNGHATLMQVSGQQANRLGNLRTVVLSDQRDRPGWRRAISRSLRKGVVHGAN